MLSNPQVVLVIFDFGLVVMGTTLWFNKTIQAKHFLRLNIPLLLNKKNWFLPINWHKIDFVQSIGLGSFQKKGVMQYRVNFS